jgi:hypothetical protein
MQSRRRLLEVAGRFGLVAWLAGLAGGLWRGRGARAADEERAFMAYLDTLIPGDGEAPGALALGIPERLRAAGAAADLIAPFCTWLDARAREAGGRSFADLPVAAREAIVQAAELAAPDSLARRAFRRTRHEAFATYYADARSWPGIGYRGPPQPDGFPDYAQPPRDG